MWVVEPDGQPITGIPVSGVVPIFASIYPSGEEVTVTVTDPDGQPVAGTAEYFTERLVWRADQPLEPNTVYHMTIEDEWSTPQMLEFTTGAADDQVGQPVLEATRALTEAERVVDSICCASGSINTCTGEPEYDTCWAQEYEYKPLLLLELDIDDRVRRFWRFEAVDADASSVDSSLDTVGGKGVSAVYSGGRDRYCVTVIATSLITGDEVSARHCAPDSELSPVDRSEAEQPDGAACDGDLVDGETGEEIPPEVIDEVIDEEGGCSAAGGPRGGALVAAALLLVALLCGRRHARR